MQASKWGFRMFNLLLAMSLAWGVLRGVDAQAESRFYVEPEVMAIIPVDQDDSGSL